MRSSTRAWSPLSLLAAVLLLQSAGCADTPVAPTELSSLSIGVTLSGVDNNETLTVSVGGRDYAVSPTTRLVLTSVMSGRLSVALSGFGANCSLEGPNPIIVEAPPRGVANVDFRITCTATSGVIAVAVAVSGRDDAVWLRVQVEGTPEQWIRGNQKTLVGSFPGGSHLVTVVDVPVFCTVVGDATTGVSITTGGLTQDTVLASFHVDCEPKPPLTADGAGVVFQRADQIALIREDGSNLVVLTPGQAPAWGPEGGFFVFQKPRCVEEWPCSADLWMMRPDGSGAREITRNDSFYDYDPVVSPDGRKVAFMRFWLGPDQSYLAVTDLSGMSTLILSMWHPVSTPTWSPDGTRIAFTCEPRGVPLHGGLDICVVTPTGGCTSYFGNECVLPALLYLTDTPFVESEPAWSPDGQHIAITLACLEEICPPRVEPRKSYVALLNPMTRAVTNLVPGHSPAWSPDGNRIVFAGNADSPGLQIVNLDGTGLTRLTDDPRDTAPSWR